MLAREVELNVHGKYQIMESGTKRQIHIEIKWILDPELGYIDTSDQKCC